MLISSSRGVTLRPIRSDSVIFHSAACARGAFGLTARTPAGPHRACSRQPANGAAHRGLRARWRLAERRARRSRRFVRLDVPRGSTRARVLRPCSGLRARALLLAPEGAELRKTTRAYRDGTLVLETTFELPEGRVRVVDCMPPRNRTPDIVRLVECLEGEAAMRMELVVRFDYGSVVPWVLAPSRRPAAGDCRRRCARAPDGRGDARRRFDDGRDVYRSSRPEGAVRTFLVPVSRRAAGATRCGEGAARVRALVAAVVAALQLPRALAGSRRRRSLR